MRSRILDMFLLANAFFLVMLLFGLIVETIASGNIELLLRLEFYSNVLSQPILWITYFFIVVIFTGKSLYSAVVRKK